MGIREISSSFKLLEATVCETPLTVWVHFNLCETVEADPRGLWLLRLSLVLLLQQCFRCHPAPV